MHGRLRAWRSAATQASAFFGRLLVPLHLCAADRICREHGPRTKWATLDGAVSIKNKVETPTIDAAALWRSLRSLPFLGAARAHARRVHADKSFTINIGFHARQGALFVQGCGSRRRRPVGTYRMLPLFGSAGNAPREPVDGFIPEGDGAAGPAESLQDYLRGRTPTTRWRPGCSARPRPRRGACSTRLGDGVDDAALKAVPQFANLRCLNVMRTYAVSDLAASPAAHLQAPLVALSLHVDGPAQNADAVARVLASTPAAASLKVLALSDHAQTERSTFTDRGLEACAAFPQLGRLLIDDAGALTVRGVAQFLREAPSLRQLGLRNCSASNLRGAPELREAAAAAGVALLWEPRAARPKERAYSERTHGPTIAGRLPVLDLRALCVLLLPSIGPHSRFASVATRHDFSARSPLCRRRADLGAIKSGIDEHRSNEAIAPHGARAKEPEQPYGH